MDIYVVVTVFQGVFDDVMPFLTEKEADEFIENLKADYIEESTLQAVKKRLEIP